MTDDRERLEEIRKASPLAKHYGTYHPQSAAAREVWEAVALDLLRERDGLKAELLTTNEISSRLVVERDTLKRELGEARKGEDFWRRKAAPESESERDAARARVKELEATLKNGHLWPSEVVESSAPHLMPDGSASRLAVVPSWVVEQFKSLAQERGAMVVTLREALEVLLPMVKEWHAEFPRDIGDKEAPAIEAAQAALTSTADAAEKVRREILEDGTKRTIGMLHGLGYRITIDDQQAVTLAILREDAP